MAATVLHPDPIDEYFSILVDKVNNLVILEDVFTRGFSMKSQFEASNVLVHCFASGIEIGA